MRVDGKVYAGCWLFGMALMGAIALMLTGCAGPYAALQKANDAAAERAGIPKAAVTQARNWLGIPIAGKATVPDGYDLICDRYLDGKLIDVTRIKEVWRIEARGGAPAFVVPTAPETTADIIKDIGHSISNATSSAALMEAIGNAGK